MSSIDSSNGPPVSGQGGPGEAASSEATDASGKPGDAARRLLRGIDRAALATVLTGDPGRGGQDSAGWPYPSLVQVALDHDASPLLLLSTLADHTRNLLADPRVGLLFDGTAGLTQPLAGARVSVLGRAERSEEPRHRARFLARHPGAALYAGFGDFAIYKVSVERAHLVAGFGRVHWLPATDLLLPEVPPDLAAAEPAILSHMNTDHADTVRLCATVLAGAADAEDWTLTGVDPDGCDLRSAGTTARVDFDQRVTNADGAKVALAGLARLARLKLSSSATDATGN